MNVVVLLLVLFVLSGCSTAMFDDDAFAKDLPQQVDTSELPPQEEDGEIPEDNAPKVGEIAKDAHGVVNVHRHGPGYDILVSLDAGDSDMIFTMDLPEGSEEFDEQSLFPEQPESLIEDIRFDEVAEEDQLESIEEATEDQPDVRQKMMSMFYNSTKHILNAQKLFYRKDYWAALDQTNKAMELVPNSAQAHALKGSIYYKMGLKKEARQSWIKALEIDPSMNDVRLTLQRMR